MDARPTISQLRQDSGKIIYMLDQNILLDLKFPHFWFENTPQGKYMRWLTSLTRPSRQFVAQHKRGLREKVRRGEMPGVVPVGYINDIRTKNMWVINGLRFDLSAKRSSYMLAATSDWTKSPTFVQQRRKNQEPQSRRRTQGWR